MGSAGVRAPRRSPIAGASIAFLATTLIAGCAGGEEPGAPPSPPRSPADTAPAPAGAQDLPDLAARTRETLGRLEQDPGSTDLRARFLFLFLEVIEVDAEGPGEGTVFGDSYRKAFDLAGDGDGDFLIALMRGSRKLYPRSIAAWEGINGILWRVLEEQPQLTLDALATLPEEERTEIIGWEYLHPVHDRFDFPRILADLEEARVPAGMDHEVEKIKEVVRWRVPD